MSIGSTNISTTLVGNTIGVGSHNIGLLCISENVNKWDKYKPVSYPTITGITLAQIQSVNYGLTIPSTDSNSDGLLLSTFIYNKPFGGATSPYRLGDFRGYNHQAIQPYSLQIPVSITTGQGGLQVKIIDSNVASDNVSLTDLFGVKYLGVCIQKTTDLGTQMQFKTATTTIVAGGNVVGIGDCDLVTSSGSVVITAFITGTIINAWNSSVTQMMYSLNCDENVATKYVVIAAAGVNTYSFAFSGLQSVDSKKISKTGTAVLNAGQVYQAAKLTGVLTYSYNLVNIKLTVYKNSDNSIAFTNTYATDINSEPSYLEAGNLINENISFNTTYNSPSLPSLTGGDFYRFVYTMQY